MSDHAPPDPRKIIHIDMDAFYASVEVLDAPELKGKPVIVGGSPESRGVVATASYEARKFGVHSAMAASRAKQLCPNAIFIRSNFTRYKEVSRQIHQIFHEFANTIEPLALDEAWLDVTKNPKGIQSATHLAQQIKATILQEVGLTCSAGVSFNKFLSKIASDENKPNGLFVISPQNAQTFLMKMPIKKIPGVGKVTAKHLAELGIQEGHHLFQHSEAYLVEQFGKLGHTLYQRVRGIDSRPVTAVRETKSISVETTFSEDLRYGPQLLEELQTLVDDLWQRCHRQSLMGKTLTLKIKFADFHQITRSVSGETFFSSPAELWQHSQQKMEYVGITEFPNRPIRLIGVGVSNFQKESPILSHQLDFFDLFTE